MQVTRATQVQLPSRPSILGQALVLAPAVQVSPEGVEVENTHPNKMSLTMQKSVLLVLEMPRHTFPTLEISSARETQTNNDNRCIASVKDYASNPFVHLQQRMLSSAGTDLTDWTPIAPEWLNSPAASVLDDELTSLIEPCIHTLDSTIFQDPHIGRLLPIWQRVLERSRQRVTYLLPLCSPQQLVAALRPSISTWHAKALWLRHVLDTEPTTRNQPRVLLIDENRPIVWQNFLPSLGFQLGLNGKVLLASHNNTPSIRDSHSYSHNYSNEEHYSNTEFNSAIDSWTQRAWRALQALCKNDNDNTSREQLDTIYSAFNSACSLLGGPLRYHQLRNDSLQARDTKQRSEIQHLTMQLELAKASTDTLTASYQQQQKLLHTTLLQLNALQTSTAWRSAEPIRWLYRRNPSLVQRSLQMSRLATWAVTGKLSSQRQLQSRADTLLRSGLFDPDHYIKHNPEIVLNGQDPIVHWISHGWRERRAPHPLFDTDWYLQEHPDVADSGIDPLTHFLNGDNNASRKPCVVFDSTWYLDQNPQVAASGLNPLVHYLRHGASAGLDPSPLFDHNWYMQQSPDVVASGVNPLAHYLAFGATAGRSPCPLFSSSWYVQRYPEVANAGINPLVHFLKDGAAKDYDPGPQFDTRWYRQKHPTINETNINPLAHFLCIGTHQAFLPNPTAKSPVHVDQDNAHAILDKSYMLTRILPHRDRNLCNSIEVPLKPATGILIVGDEYPSPAADDGSSRIRKILDCLKEMKRDLVFFNDQATIDPSHITDTLGKGVTTITGIKAALRHLVAHGNSFSIVLLSSPSICERYLPLVRAFANEAIVLYDTANPHRATSPPHPQMVSTPLPKQKTADRNNLLNLTNARSTDITLVNTNAERAALLAQGQDLDISVIPTTAHDKTNIPTPFHQRNDLLFIGTFSNSSEIEAIQYMVSKILPRVTKRLPSIRLHIVSRQKIPNNINTLASKNIDLTPHIEDLSPWLSESRVLVAPLLSGSGMKDTFSLALHFGLPVVTTTIGAQALLLKNHHTALIGDSPKEIATYITDCHQNQELWQQLSATGLQFIAQQNSTTTLCHRIAELVQTNKPLK